MISPKSFAGPNTPAKVAYLRHWGMRYDRVLPTLGGWFAGRPFFFVASEETLQHFAFSHRTMAEVYETEELLALKRRGEHRPGYNWRRLDVLLVLEEANNPPPPLEPDDAA